MNSIEYQHSELLFINSGLSLPFSTISPALPRKHSSSISYHQGSRLDFANEVHLQEIWKSEKEKSSFFSNVTGRQVSDVNFVWASDILKLPTKVPW